MTATAQPCIPGPLRRFDVQRAKTQRHTKEQVVSYIGIVRTLTMDVSELKGDNLERRYHDRAPASFVWLVRRARLLSVEALDALLCRHPN